MVYPLSKNKGKLVSHHADLPSLSPEGLGCFTAAASLIGERAHSHICLLCRILLLDAFAPTKEPQNPRTKLNSKRVDRQ